MNIYTVSLFGHRELDNYNELKRNLSNVIISLIDSKEYVEFLIGRNGEFDIHSASIIKDTCKNYRAGNFDLTLVLPYMTAEFMKNESSFYRYYDNIEIFDSVHYKSAIIERNKSMIDRSDFSIFYLRKNFGGTYQTYHYAQIKEKAICMI